ncbi:MAG: response regulator [Candidatus Riflebacteria bacterium]|nr:response regulator [Candidatus Riflebacteria bacterium]
MTLEPNLKESPVLIVDDQLMIRVLLTRHLKQSGFTNVADVTNGQEALDALKAKKYDLVLLDINMPVLDGYATLQRIKADETLRDVAVIMVTAVDEIESVARCIQIGADDYMPKLFNPILLDARILSLLELHALRRRLGQPRQQARVNGC